MKDVQIHNEYITLGQFLKLVNAVDSGVIAKLVIQDGQVFVNQEIEIRRGKKLYHNDIVSFDGIDYRVVHEN